MNGSHIFHTSTWLSGSLRRPRRCENTKLQHHTAKQGGGRLQQLMLSTCFMPFLSNCPAPEAGDDQWPPLVCHCGRYSILSLPWYWVGSEHQKAETSDHTVLLPTAEWLPPSSTHVPQVTQGCGNTLLLWVVLQTPHLFFSVSPCAVLGNVIEAGPRKSFATQRTDGVCSTHEDKDPWKGSLCTLTITHFQANHMMLSAQSSIPFFILIYTSFDLYLHSNHRLYDFVHEQQRENTAPPPFSSLS